MSNELFEVIDAGLIHYDIGLQLQRECFDAVLSGARGHVLIVCRHDPVITIGRSGGKEYIMAGENDLLSRGIEVRAVDRGGGVTYHGPGQLTVYPVFNLERLRKDIRWFLGAIETAVVHFLSGYGIAAGVREGLRGVWIGDRKIAAIGVAVRRWISWHGFSVAVRQTELSGFSLIRPCGMDVRVTTMEEQTGRVYQHTELAGAIAQACRDVFAGRA